MIERRLYGWRGQRRSRAPELSDYFPEATDDDQVYDPDDYNGIGSIRQGDLKYYAIVTISSSQLMPIVTLPFIFGDGWSFIIKYKLEYIAGIFIFLGSYWYLLRKSDQYKYKYAQHRDCVVQGKIVFILAQSKVQKGLMDEFGRAQIRGDVIVSGAGNNVFVNSQIVNSLNAVQARDSGLSEANAQGRCNHLSDPNVKLPLDPDFQGYAELTTGRDGHYTITTIKSGPYRKPRGDMRAPHIRFDIQGVVDRKSTHLLFPGEPLNM